MSKYGIYSLKSRNFKMRLSNFNSVFKRAWIRISPRIYYSYLFIASQCKDRTARICLRFAETSDRIS